MESSKLTYFQDASVRLLAHKMLIEFKAFVESGVALEPESFVEHWLDHYIIDKTGVIQEFAWHYFIDELRRGTRG